jgi:hypothetical protein
MTFQLKIGPRTWSSSQDEEGYVTYTVVNLVITDDPHDGPQQARETPGLYVPGSLYQIGNDSDFYAWCRWNDKITPLYKNEQVREYEVEQYFSNKPLPPEKNRCQDVKIEDPVRQPAKISGAGSKYSEEATYDRFGNQLLNSAQEMLRGPHVEFDANRPTIKISMNVLSYDLCVLAQAMQDHVNSAPLWGWPPRCVKLSSAPFQKLFYGGCSVYFQLDLEFEINPRTFDRDLIDEGTKALHGRWNLATGAWDLIDINGKPPNPLNPAHFDRFKDRKDEACRCILDGHGKPLVTLDPDAVLTCASCPDGAPTFWEALGLVFSFVAVPPTDFPDRLQLTYDSDCLWIGNGTVAPGNPVFNPGAGVVLGLTKTAQTYDIANGIQLINPWRFEVQDVAGDVVGHWFADAADWNCTGVNDMLSLTQWARDVDNPLVQGDARLPIDPNDESMPESVVLMPNLGTRPGKIHVEHYDEAYFPLLGIPLTFTV